MLRQRMPQRDRCAKQGVTTLLTPRRGVWVPHGDSAGGVFHEEPVVAPMSPSMRPASNAWRIISRCSRCSLMAALDAHAGDRRSGLASLERDPDAGRDREQEWPVTAVLVEPAVGEFPDLGGVAVCAAQARSQCLRRSASNCASKRATSRRSLLLVSRRK
jgi:hypothetical protein